MYYRRIGPPWARTELCVEDEGLRRGIDYLFGNVGNGAVTGGAGINVRVLNFDNYAQIAGRIPEEYFAGHYLTDDKYYARFRDWAGVFDFGTGEGSVTAQRGNFTGVDTFLRQISIYYSYINGYLPFHSVAFEYLGEAYLCPGESDSGKSTIAAMIKDEATVYSDEINVIGGEAGEVWSLPFRGTSQGIINPGGASITAVLIHRKAPAASVEEIGYKEALLDIQKSVIVPVFADSDIRNKAYDLLTGILSSIDVRIINFPKNGRIFLDAVETIGGN